MGAKFIIILCLISYPLLNWLLSIAILVVVYGLVWFILFPVLFWLGTGSAFTPNTLYIFLLTCSDLILHGSSLLWSFVHCVILMLKQNCHFLYNTRVHKQVCSICWTQGLTVGSACPRVGHNRAAQPRLHWIYIWRNKTSAPSNVGWKLGVRDPIKAAGADSRQMSQHKQLGVASQRPNCQTGQLVVYKNISCTNPSHALLRGGRKRAHVPFRVRKVSRAPAADFERDR